MDDVLVTETCEANILATKLFLDAQFTIKDLGPAKFFLGLQNDHSSSGRYSSQCKYIQVFFIRDVKLTNAKPATTPLPRGMRLISNDDSHPLPNPERYCRLVGRLVYLNLTRSDVTFSIQQLSQFMQLHINHIGMQHFKSSNISKVAIILAYTTHPLVLPQFKPIVILIVQFAPSRKNMLQATAYCWAKLSSPRSPRSSPQ